MLTRSLCLGAWLQVTSRTHKCMKSPLLSSPFKAGLRRGKPGVWVGILRKHSSQVLAWTGALGEWCLQIVVPPDCGSCLHPPWRLGLLGGCLVCTVAWPQGSTWTAAVAVTHPAFLTEGEDMTVNVIIQCCLMTVSIQLPELAGVLCLN